MKHFSPFFARYRRLVWLGLLAGVFSLVSAQETPQQPTAPPAPAPELNVVVSQTISPRGESPDAFERFALYFPEVTESRKWPIKVRVDRLAAGEPDHPVELRVFLMGIRQDVPDQFTLRAWLTLVDNGKKTDFGIIRATRDHRYMQPIDRIVDMLYKDIAISAADKVEPLLFQRTRSTQQKSAAPTKSSFTSQPASAPLHPTAT